MEKIKRDKLLKEAEEQAHKEIADEEVKRRSISAAVQKLSNNQTNIAQKIGPQVSS